MNAKHDFTYNNKFRSLKLNDEMQEFIQFESRNIYI